MKLELMRAELIQTGITHGFGHEKTIHLSKQVDELLNLYDDERRGMHDSES